MLLYDVNLQVTETSTKPRSTTEPEGMPDVQVA